MSEKETTFFSLIDPDKMITKNDFDEKMAQRALLESKTHRKNACKRLQALIHKVLLINSPTTNEQFQKDVTQYLTSANVMLFERVAEIKKSLSLSQLKDTDAIYAEIEKIDTFTSKVEQLACNIQLLLLKNNRR